KTARRHSRRNRSVSATFSMDWRGFGACGTPGRASDSMPRAWSALAEALRVKKVRAAYLPGGGPGAGRIGDPGRAPGARTRGGTSVPPQLGSGIRASSLPFRWGGWQGTPAAVPFRGVGVATDPGWTRCRTPCDGHAEPVSDGRSSTDVDSHTPRYAFRTSHVIRANPPSFSRPLTLVTG